jgi:PIN domain nuclease of toxin-antitoxin system
MKVLLDSCTFLWLAMEPEKLSPLAVATINDEANQLFLSDVSLWEIALKNHAGKLPLPDRPAIWLPEQRAFHQLTPVAIIESAVFLTSDLPRIPQRPVRPADRRTSH